MIKDISNMFYFILQGYLQGYQIVWLYVYCYYLESSEICFNFRVFFIFISCVIRLVAVLNLLPHTLQG